MRGHYEQAKLIIPQPFIEVADGVFSQPRQAYHNGLIEPSLRSKHYGAGSGSAKLSEYFLPPARSFSDTQAELPEGAPSSDSGHVAFFHLVGPIFVEVGYVVEPEADGGDVWAEVSPILVYLILKEPGQIPRILSVHGWEAAPDSLRSIVVHPSAAELGWSDEAILEAVKERFQAGQRE